ncbi:hypothetical protein AB5I41_28235 [Sphingomonas sp. MMS24-JH45]
MRPRPSTPFGQDEDAGGPRRCGRGRAGRPRAAVALIRGQLEDGQGAAALAGAERLVRAAPGAPAAQQLLGDVLFATGRAASAAAAYAKAADLRFDGPAMLHLVEPASRPATARARPTCSRSIRAEPQDPVARALANAQLAAGDDDAAATLDGLLGDLGGRDALLLAQATAAHETVGEDALAEHERPTACNR